MRLSSLRDRDPRDSPWSEAPSFLIASDTATGVFFLGAVDDMIVEDAVKSTSLDGCYYQRWIWRYSLRLIARARAGLVAQRRFFVSLRKTGLFPALFVIFAEFTRSLAIIRALGVCTYLPMCMFPPCSPRLASP